MSRENVEIVRCDRCGATETVPIKQSPGSIEGWTLIKIASEPSARMHDLCGDCAVDLERFMRCTPGEKAAHMPPNTILALTTCDPGFNPKASISINGFLYHPDGDSPL